MVRPIGGASGGLRFIRVGVAKGSLPSGNLIDVVVVGGIYREVLDGDAVPRRRLGGSGLVAAIIAARLGAVTALVSFIGLEDAATGLAMLDAANVDSSQVDSLPGASGTFVFPSKTQHPWPMYRPAEATPTTKPSIPAARAYLVFGMPDFDAVAEGWLELLPRDATLLWDRQGWLSRARDYSSVSSLRPAIKVYLANEDEALTEFGSGTDDLISRLPPEGYEWAAIKRGRDGCVLVERSVHGNTHHLVDGFPVDTLDTIGSGDAFAGGLAASIATRGSALNSATMANAVASAFIRLNCDPLAPGLPESARALLAPQPGS
jgi:sugar/nucleoside kinase (ribokinase family)